MALLSKVVLIRHAESRTNQLYTSILNYMAASSLPDQAFKPIFFAPSSVDVPLTEAGVQQAISAAKDAREVNFNTVWVSPLRRTLDTAFFIFREHPNFYQIRFKVHPLIREKMRVSGDMPTCDVLNMIEREFQPKFKGRLEINWMEEASGKEQHIFEVKDQVALEDCWYFSSLNEDLQAECRVKFDQMAPEERDVDVAISEALSSIYPRHQESILNVKKRADLFKAELDKHLKDNQFLYGEGAQDGKLGVVTHQSFVKVLTCRREYWERADNSFELMPGAEESAHLRNCEFLPLKLA
mmetsp:Transcript_4678/g.7959  ORF Transcript_4678/g.7959 Transcript_4678/m.7959 type:complete len:297 (-) Transcript_4678:15-905(-)